MSKLKYVKLTANQKLEIVKYWEENHYPYHVIASHYSQQWGQRIGASTVADIVNYWKKWKTVRGSSKTVILKTSITDCVLQTLLFTQNLDLRISKECIHAICMGELNATSETLSLQSVESVLEENKLMDSPALWKDGMLNQAETDVRTLPYPSSSILFLESFYLLWRCAPYRPFCFAVPLSNPAYRDPVNAFVVYSADGSYRSPPFLYGKCFTTSMEGDSLLVKEKKAAVATERGFQCMHADALARFLVWLNASMGESHFHLIYDNAQGLIQSIEENGSDQRVLFATSSVTLHSLHLTLFPRFSLRSPFAQGLLRRVKLEYRMLFLEKLVAMQVNHRGYKRLLAIEDCASLLTQAWTQIPNSFISCCVHNTKLISPAEASELSFTQAQDAFDTAFHHFYSLFTIREEDRVSADCYLRLETYPVIGGLNSLQECVSDLTSRELLFYHASYPQVPSSPISLHQQRKSVLPVEMETPSDVAFLEAFPFPPNVEGLDLFYHPTPDMVYSFCTCLDSFLNSDYGFSGEDLAYYADLKERLQRYYC